MKKYIIFTGILFSLLCVATAFAQVPEVIVTPDSSSKSDSSETSEKSSEKKSPKGKSFDKAVEDFEQREGLFTLYYHAEKDQLYMEILPSQLDGIFLMNLTRDGGDGSMFDGGAMIGNFAFYFRRVGERIQLVHKNLRFRADSQAAIARAIDRDIPDSIFKSARILSLPHPEKGSLLIDARSLFIADVGSVNNISGRNGSSYSLDQQNSWILEARSFPQNCEITVALHFTSAKSQPVFTLADSRSMIHRYHYSLSQLPETDYRPRNADDRIGHFYTFYQDYTSLLERSAYRRVINRWHLEKSEPRFALSPARQPIVIWLENTIPLEYRDAIRNGVLAWNAAFREIGFKDPLVVNQMPDDATWDPADSRYNVIRWIIRPGMRYAVANFRANPFTGQIYDADIRISADVVRGFSSEFQDYLQPSSLQNYSNYHNRIFLLAPDSLADGSINQCRMADGLYHQMHLGWQLATLHNKLRPEDLEQFIQSALTHLTAHEIGHILGLRHNFKASGLLNQQGLAEKARSRKPISGSVMDYVPVNLQAEKISDQFFQTEPGPYDYWAIAYAYRQWDSQDPASEAQQLRKIARRSGEPQLTFATDEDAFAFSSRGIDPSAALWDLGANSIAHYQHRLDLVDQMWESLPQRAGKSVERYPELRTIFNGGVLEYFFAGLTVSKWIGGVHINRRHPGDPGGNSPMQVVPADQQQAALDFLIKYFYSPGSFQFKAELLNQLAPERLWDFQGTVFRMQRLDYPIHGIVQAMQAITLFRLYDPVFLLRLQDNEVRFTNDDQRFTLQQLLDRLDRAIWSEIPAKKSINSYRRELQRMHLYLQHQILINRTTLYPHDVIALTRYHLKRLGQSINLALENNDLDTYSRAHLQYVREKIDAILAATMIRNN